MIQQSNLTRRDALTLLGSAGAASFLLPSALRAADMDPRVTGIVTKTISVDMHNHVGIPYVRGGTPDPKADPALDVAGELRKSGFTAVCQTYAVDSLRDAKPGEYYEYHLQALDYEDRLLPAQKMHRVFNMKQLEAAYKQKTPVIIQAAEGGQFIEGHPERVEEAYKRGLRLLQLVHQRNDLTSPIGDIQTQPPNALGGLTPFGAQVIKECNRLGIVVDLAHGALGLVQGALKVSAQPLLVSHTAMNSPVGRGNTGANAPGLLRRLIEPEHARAVAQAGGVVGIWRLFDTMKEYVAAVKEMVDVAGIDHVGIGTDTDITNPGAKNVPFTNKIWPDQDSGFLYAVVGEMLKQQFAPADISKIIGGNFCRVFAKVTAGHG